VRARLAVGLALIGIAAVALVWRPWDGGPAYTDTRHASVVEVSVTSRLLDRSLDEVVVLPAKRSTRPPLLVLLQGRGSSTSQWLSDELFAELERLGPRAPALLVVAGGDHSYYHDRKDGLWGAYVLREAIPAGLKTAQADPRRVAIGGISMGGFGALDQARIAPLRFCAVGGHSPALWRSGAATPSGAFDNAEDFARHDVIGAARAGKQFGLGPVWLDAGESDPFLEATKALGRLLHVRVHVAPGGHDRGYWRRHVAEYLRFYAGALARCGA
jgi:S-formylglutathione hydrolase FrmB